MTCYQKFNKNTGNQLCGQNSLDKRERNVHFFRNNVNTTKIDNMSRCHCSLHSLLLPHTITTTGSILRPYRSNS